MISDKLRRRAANVKAASASGKKRGISSRGKSQAKIVSAKKRSVGERRKMIEAYKAGRSEKSMSAEAVAKRRALRGGKTRVAGIAKAAPQQKATPTEKVEKKAGGGMFGGIFGSGKRKTGIAGVPTAKPSKAPTRKTGIGQSSGAVRVSTKPRSAGIVKKTGPKTGKAAFRIGAGEKPDAVGGVGLFGISGLLKKKRKKIGIK